MSDPLRFNYAAAPQRVIHGAGRAAELGAELAQLGARRAVLLCSPGQLGVAQEMSTRLGELCAGVLPLARVHVPAELAREACEQARRLDADALVALGGGSAIGLAKALALQTALPIVALPTTYAGSEATPIYGITRDGDKQTGRDPRVLPRVVIYDAELSAALPMRVSVASALNGMAHAVEALYASDRSPVTDALAQHGLRLFTSGLDALSGSDPSLEVRGQLLSAAWLCGHVLGQTRMGLHHKLCHVLGGRFDLPHAELHALILPHVLELNAARRPELLDPLADAMGVANPVHWWRAQLANAGLPTALTQFGVGDADLDPVADLILSQPYPHPFAVGRPELLKLLRTASGVAESPEKT